MAAQKKQKTTRKALKTSKPTKGSLASIEAAFAYADKVKLDLNFLKRD